MASGIISPSELPDSPSQTIPQSPRRIHHGLSSPYMARDGRNQDGPLRSVFEDDVNTFGVENTPAQFSCATSLSNLSLDDEPKIATDGLIKEMRLMNHPSDELDDVAVDFQSDGADLAGAQSPTSMLAEQPTLIRGDHAKDKSLSDSDDSVNDSILLATCIYRGLNRGGPVDVDQSPTTAPPLPPRNMPPISNAPYNRDDFSVSDGSDIDDEALMKQCIRDGMQKCQGKPTPAQRNINVPNIPTLPSKLVKENPIGMLRKGGKSMVNPLMDEVKGYQEEGSPCTFSVMSGLSDLTVGSHVASLAKPAANEDVELDKHSLSSLSGDSDGDSEFFKQVIYDIIIISV